MALRSPLGMKWSATQIPSIRFVRRAPPRLKLVPSLLCSQPDAERIPATSLAELRAAQFGAVGLTSACVGARTGRGGARTPRLIAEICRY